jgi:hypothetical protein
MYLRLAVEHLHYAIEHAMMLGYADGAYIYSRMLARYVLDIGAAGVGSVGSRQFN